MSKETKAGKAQGAKPAKPEIPTETFKADGVEYKFTRAQFIVPGIGKMTAAEALENEEALAVLVQNESAVIEVVGEAKKEKAPKKEKAVKEEKGGSE